MSPDDTDSLFSNAVEAIKRGDAAWILENIPDGAPVLQRTGDGDYDGHNLLDIAYVEEQAAPLFELAAKGAVTNNFILNIEVPVKSGLEETSPLAEERHKAEEIKRLLKLCGTIEIVFYAAFGFSYSNQEYDFPASHFREIIQRDSDGTPLFSTLMENQTPIEGEFFEFARTDSLLKFAKKILADEIIEKYFSIMHSFVVPDTFLKGGEEFVEDFSKACENVGFPTTPSWKAGEEKQGPEKKLLLKMLDLPAYRGEVNEIIEFAAKREALAKAVFAGDKDKIAELIKDEPKILMMPYGRADIPLVLEVTGRIIASRFGGGVDDIPDRISAFRQAIAGLGDDTVSAILSLPADTDLSLQTFDGKQFHLARGRNLGDFLEQLSRDEEKKIKIEGLLPSENPLPTKIIHAAATLSNPSQRR